MNNPQVQDLDEMLQSCDSSTISSSNDMEEFLTEYNNSSISDYDLGEVLKGGCGIVSQNDAEALISALEHEECED